MIPGRGCLRALIIVIVGLGLLADGGDVVARHYATSQVEKRIRAVAPDAQGVHAHIRSWPFLKVLVTGHVDEMGARISRVTVDRLTFSNVDVEIHALKVKTGPLVSHGKVVVDHIHNGTVTAMVKSADLTRAVGLPVSIGSGGFLVQGAPVTFTVNPSNRTLVVHTVGASLSFPLPGADLLPCAPTIAFSDQAVTLSCTFDHIPAAFTNVG